MPIYKDKSTHQSTRCFITLSQDLQLPMQYVRASGNNIAIINQDGRIMEEYNANCKILPINLTNEQICQRTLIDGVQQLSQGMNMSIFYIGSTLSGKQKLADGNKNQFPICQYLFDKIISCQKRKNRKTQYRIKMIVVINQKIYDCFETVKNSGTRLKQERWQGVQPVTSKTVPISSTHEFGVELSRAIKQKNKLAMQLKDFYTTHLCVQIIQKHPEDQRQYLVSKLNVFQIGGVQCLNTTHSVIKIKDTPTSTRSLVGFSSLVQEMARFPDSIIHYEASQLTYLVKQIIGCNSSLYAFLTLKVSEIQGSMSTLRFLQPLGAIQQYPLINDSLGYGTIKKFRQWALYNGMHNQNEQYDDQKKQLQEQILRLQAQQDYKRLLQKYTQLKSKYSQALKQKSQAQLQLIKCQQEKLQIGKSLVQIQIQNTKLLEKLQNRDYQNGKKLLNAENMLAQRQMSYQECLDRINQLQQGLDDALQTKRQLQVQFIALKRNFLLQQKQLRELKQDNQNLGVDIINLSKQNQRLKKAIMQDTDGLYKNRNNLIIKFQQDKYDQMIRLNKQNQQNINYLKSQIQRYKKQIIQLQMNLNGFDTRNNDQFGKDYRRIQLENQNMELQNKFKLQLRKIQQLEEKVGFFMEENQRLQEQIMQMRKRDHDQTQQYRQKMQRYAKNTSAQAIVKQLKQNFLRKDTQHLDKINSLKRDLSEKKKQIINLKGYGRQLVALLQQWGPKGIEIPSIKKYQNMNLNPQKGSQVTQELRIRNIRLQQQIKRMKNMSSSQMKQSRALNQISMLQQSQISGQNPTQIIKLKKQKNELAQQNKKLTILLKDGNKMDLNILKKQNENLKKQIDNLKNSMSISPSTSDQKLKFYQKHLKLLQKQRSQLISRSVIAQQQLKNLLAKVSNGNVKVL